jgi:hypothetical protein
MIFPLGEYGTAEEWTAAWKITQIIKIHFAHENPSSWAHRNGNKLRHGHRLRTGLASSFGVPFEGLLLLLFVSASLATGGTVLGWRIPLPRPLRHDPLRCHCCWSQSRRRPANFDSKAVVPILQSQMGLKQNNWPNHGDYADEAKLNSHFV